MSGTRRDALGAIVFVVVGVAGLAGLQGLPFGSASSPGPAMLPSILSALIVALALVHLARALRAAARARGEHARGACPAVPAANAAIATGAIATDAMTTGAPAGQAEVVDSPPAGSRLLRVALASLVIAAYVAAARPFGFVATTFVAMSALYAIGSGGRGVGRAILAGAVLTAATWLLFGLMLGVPLPRATLLD